MSEGYEIDLDGEQVLFDGTWYSKEELGRKIKSMVDAGDYRVSRPSVALESLQNALSNLRTLSVRLPAALAEALALSASRQGQPVGAFVREALARSLPQRIGTPLPMPMAPHSSSSSGIPTLEPLTEPPSAEEMASAISLTPKRRDDTRK